MFVLKYWPLFSNQNTAIAKYIIPHIAAMTNMPIKICCMLNVGPLVELLVDVFVTLLLDAFVEYEYEAGTLFKEELPVELELLVLLLYVLLKLETHGYSAFNRLETALLFPSG